MGREDCYKKIGCNQGKLCVPVIVLCRVKAKVACKAKEEPPIPPATSLAPSVPHFSPTLLLPGFTPQSCNGEDMPLHGLFLLPEAFFTHCTQISPQCSLSSILALVFSIIGVPSNSLCLCVCVFRLCCVWLFATPWTVACQVTAFCLWNFPGKNTGAGCHLLFQWIFLTQGSNPCLLHTHCVFYL